MLGRPLSPWRGPEGPLTRLRASRGSLALIAAITVVILVVVGIALAVGGDDPALGSAGATGEPASGQTVDEVPSPEV